MATISELLVEVRPEGIDQTNEQLDRHGDQFEETAEQVEDQTDRLEDFSQRWSGAMSTLVAGLAVAAAGLLTQVPILGEVFGGLLAIIDALAFQMDQVLRPVLQPLTGILFDISGAIFGLEGPLGTFVGLLSTAVAVGTPLVAILSRLGLVSFTLSGILSGLVGWVSGLVSGTLALPAALGAIIGLFGVWVLETLGVLDAVRNLGRWVANQLPGFVRDGILTIIGIFAGPLAVIGGFVTGFIEGGFEEGFERAREVIDTFIGAAVRLFRPVADLIMGLFDTLRNIASQTWDAIVEVSMNLLGFDRQQFESGQSQTVSFPGFPSVTVPGADTGGGGGGATGNPSINMDGRDLTENTGRYRVGSVSRRGRGP